MSKFVILILFSTLQVFCGLPAQARAVGGGSDGGGCGVQGAAGWVLKDYVRAHADFNQMSHDSGTPIETGPVAKMLGYEILDGTYGTVDFLQLPATVAALARLNLWAEDSPDISRLIISTIKSMHWAAILRNYKPVAFGCEDQNDHPISIYFSSEMLAMISVPFWNALPFDSQIGVVIKEALRFLQIQNRSQILGGEGLSDRSEMLLSQIVSKIALEKPRRRRNLLSGLVHRYGGTLSTPDWGALTNELHLKCKTASRELQKYSLSPHVQYPGQEQLAEHALSNLDRCQNHQLRGSSSLEEQSSLENEITALLDPVITYGMNEWMLQVRDPQTLLQNRSVNLRASETSSLISKFAMQLQLLYWDSTSTSPEFSAALQGLAEATKSMNQCARTSRGNVCSVRGIDAYREIAQAIMSRRRSSELNRNILATRALLESFNAQYLAD